MTDIRTPDDEVTTPGYFYPPFREGWHYQGATYGQRVEDGQVKPGHSPFAVDWNRRTPTGGWLQDLGDPVLAAADGTVAEVDKGDGLVLLNHYDALYRTEYRHMQDITVKVGDKVQRGDRIGSIGDVAGDGRSTSPHLHHVHYRRASKSEPFQRIKMAFEGKPVATSVGNSDTRPPSWSPPTPVMVVGPPARATWQGAYQQADRRMTRAEKLLADCGTAKGAAEGELANAKAANLLTQRRLDQAMADLASCQSAHEATTARAVALTAERDGALQRATIEQERAEAAARDLETATRTITAQGARIEALEARVAELEALPPTDCVTEVNAERARVLAAISDGMDELVAGLR
jgi:hypothetical protein